MEESQIIKEVLHALSLHSKRMDQRFDEVDRRFEEIDKRFEQVDGRFEQMDKRFEKMDKRFDHLEKKVDGIRVDLSETQETTNFLLSKAAHHDKKIQNMNEPHF